MIAIRGIQLAHLRHPLHRIIRRLVASRIMTISPRVREKLSITVNGQMTRRATLVAYMDVIQLTTIVALVALVIAVVLRAAAPVGLSALIKEIRRVVRKILFVRIRQLLGHLINQ
jgi:hypothetical protein